MTLTTNTITQEFLDAANLADEKAKKFLSLNREQLNWRPGENRWSVAECFEHLVRTNEKYLPVYQKYASGSGEEKTFKHSLIGKLILKSVTPEVKKKYKTSPSFNPIRSNISDTIVKDFIEQNNKIIEAVKNLDHSRFSEKISSPFSAFVKYNIGDSLIIIANHNLRHLDQAERVIKSETFPA